MIKNKSILKDRFLTLRLLLAILIPKKFSRVIPESLLKRIYHDKEFSVDLEGKKLKLNGTKNHFENSIFWHGLYDSTEGMTLNLLNLIMTITDKVVFWDVGANSGIYSLVVKSLNKNALVLAIEPSVQTLEKFYLNLESNNLFYDSNYSSYNSPMDRIIILPYALSNSENFVNFFYYSDENNFQYGGQIKSLNRKILKTETIRCITANKILENSTDLFPDILKIDIEGAEFEALLGFGSSVISLSVVFIEILDHASAQNIESILPSNLFRYFDIDDKSHKIFESPHLDSATHRNWLIVNQKDKNVINLLESHYLDS